MPKKCNLKNKKCRMDTFQQVINYATIDELDRMESMIQREKHLHELAKEEGYIR